MPNILDVGEKHAVKAALDQVEKEKHAEGSFEATTDGAVEASISADKWHTHWTGYAKKQFTGAKALVAGIRASWTFGGKS